MKFRTMGQNTVAKDEMGGGWARPTIQTLADQVARAILQKIAAGVLRPGDRLPPQRELSQSFEVGMSVIREAIQRLEALHVVDPGPGTGTLIRPFRWLPLIYDPTLSDMAIRRIGAADLWESRRLLEAQVGRLAATRATAADLAAIEAVLDAAGECPDYEHHYVQNRAFHLALARAARNVVLEDLLAPLVDIRFSDFVGHHFDAAHSLGAWAAHRRIFWALVARDPVEIEAAISHHFDDWAPPLAADHEAAPGSVG